MNDLLYRAVSVTESPIEISGATTPQALHPVKP